MTSLVLSDLFKDSGKRFNWANRITDQETLLNRLSAFPELKEHYDSVKEFVDEHIASIVYVEWILGKITKTCSEKNIPIS